MFRILVSTKKRELKLCILLRISSRVTTLLEIINFLKVTTMKISFTSGLTIFFYLDAEYFDSLAFVFVSVNVSNIFTCLKGFSSFLQSSSPDSKDAKGINSVAYIRAPAIGSTCTRDSYAKNISAEDISSAGGVYVKGTIVRGTYTESIYVHDASAIKYLEMHLQSFQILEVKLFETGLEIGVKTG